MTDHHPFKTLSEALASTPCPTKEKIRRDHQAKIDRLDNVYSENLYKKEKSPPTATQTTIPLQSYQPQ